MNLVPMADLLNDAYANGYGVGGFNINNMEFLQGIIWAAEEEKSPLILQASEGAIKYIGMDYVIAMVDAATKNTEIPVALHLDHGSDFDVAMRCIRRGFSSVMIDGSHYPFEENIAIVKEVVRAAHSVGVTVEAELGKLGGTEDDISVEEKDAAMTDPAEAAEFVERTGVDCLAVSVGTAHGVYQGDPEIDYARLEKIHQEVNIPLVLHGASGVPDKDVAKAITFGVSKVNVNTDFQQAFTARVKEIFAEKPALYDPRKYCGPGRDAITAKVKEKISMLGSAGQA